MSKPKDIDAVEWFAGKNMELRNLKIFRRKVEKPMRRIGWTKKDAKIVAECISNIDKKILAVVEKRNIWDGILSKIVNYEWVVVLEKKEKKK